MPSARHPRRFSPPHSVVGPHRVSAVFVAASASEWAIGSNSLTVNERE
jgi:hypothetical protein